MYFILQYRIYWLLLYSRKNKNNENVSHKKLRDFYETPGFEDSKISLERWYDIAEKAEWRNLSDMKVDFLSVDYVGNQHYVFNIKGNHYRLIVVLTYSHP